VERITARREATIDLPWSASSRLLGALLTSDEWSSERAHLVGRTNLHFVVAVRSVEAAGDSLRFRIIGDSPDLRHPVVGTVELLREAAGLTVARVQLTANLDEEPQHFHLALREAIASLAEVLIRTIAATADSGTRPVERVFAAS